MGSAGRVLPLQKGIVYGPVASRRLGRSLGINLMPTTYKACSYNCVYCHYGWTKVAVLDCRPLYHDLPTVEQVGAALRAALEAGANPEYITFSGNGEPTLHPAFSDMVDTVIWCRDQLAPQAKTCVLSNATCLGKESAARALEKLDVRILKLDAGDEQTWRLVNRPAPGLSFVQLLEGLRSTKNWVLQTLFCDGPYANCRPHQVEQWMELVGQLRPRLVQIYTIDRPAAHGRLRRVSLEVLKEIGAKASRRTGLPVHVYGANGQSWHFVSKAAGK
ncbi:MAG: radical SAM protein [candidate division KSB1 bacterium]|nr:radical SAM protein [candidate division KSB1 bacterium]